MRDRGSAAEKPSRGAGLKFRVQRDPRAAQIDAQGPQLGYGPSRDGGVMQVTCWLGYAQEEERSRARLRSV